MGSQKEKTTISKSGLRTEVRVGSLTITISARKKYARVYNILLNEQETFKVMTKNAPGKISYAVSTTIPQIFGDYSALKVEVGIEFPGDPDNLEMEIDKYDEKINNVLVAKVNQVLAEQGKDGIKIG